MCHPISDTMNMPDFCATCFADSVCSSVHPTPALSIWTTSDLLTERPKNSVILTETFSLGPLTMHSSSFFSCITMACKYTEGDQGSWDLQIPEQLLADAHVVLSGTLASLYYWLEGVFYINSVKMSSEIFCYFAVLCAELVAVIRIWCCPECVRCRNELATHAAPPLLHFCVLGKGQCTQEYCSTSMQAVAKPFTTYCCIRLEVHSQILCFFLCGQALGLVLLR